MDTAIIVLVSEVRFAVDSDAPLDARAARILRALAHAEMSWSVTQGPNVHGVYGSVRCQIGSGDDAVVGVSPSWAGAIVAAGRELIDFVTP